MPRIPNFDDYTAISDKIVIAAQIHEFLATASDSPLCFILEELQWADAASLELLRHLAHGLTNKPILLVATYRDEGIGRQHPLYGLLPILTRETDPIRLRLSPLDDAAVQTLIWARYGLSPHDEARLLAMLDRRGEGNPLFITELQRSCEEAGVLRRLQTNDRDMLLGDLEELGIPPLVQQILDARIAALGAETERLLAIAAILGREVDLELWGQVAGIDEEGLLELIERTAATGIIKELPDGSAITFRHTLIREALYESLSAPRRRLWHRRIGEILAARAQVHPANDPATIATHFAQASDPRATTWLIRAGDHAVQHHSWLVALQHYARAEQLLRISGTDEVTRGWLLYRLGRLQRYSDAAASLAVFAQAEQIARTIDNRPLAVLEAFGRALLRAYQGQIHRGIAELRGALGAWEELGQEELALLTQQDVGPGTQPPYGTLALLLAQMGRFNEAIVVAQPIAEAGPPPVPTNRLEGYPWADAWLALGIARGFTGDPDAARAAFGRARLAYQSASHHYLAGRTAAAELDLVLRFAADDLASRAWLAAETEEENTRASGIRPAPPPRIAHLPLLILEGRWAECRDLAEATLIVRDSRELPAIAILGSLAQWQGDTAAAWRIVAQGLPSGLATPTGGTDFLGTLTLIELAINLALETRDLPTARAWLEVHSRWLQWSGSVVGFAEGQLRWARYHQANDDYVRAREVGEMALRAAHAPRQPLVILSIERFLGELDTVGGAYASATAHFEVALALAEACAAPYERAITLLSVAELQLTIAATDSEGVHQTNQPTALHRARLALDEARAICTPLGAIPTLTRLDIVGARLHALEPKNEPATIPVNAPQSLESVMHLRSQALLS